MNNLLEIENLYVSYSVPIGHLKYGYKKVLALRGICLSVQSGTTIGIVGGSGSGKSTILRTILGFIKPDKGKIFFRGLDLIKLRDKERKKIAREIGYVPQEPSQSINPKMKIIDVLIEPLKPLKLSRDDIEKRIDIILEMLDLDPSIKNMYAKELSGGMIQRIAMARALVTKSKLILLDEPTSNIDISIQAQMLNMLKDLKEELNLTYILVSHDIDVVSYISDRIAVIVSGIIVEEGDTKRIIEEPLHPYTIILLDPSKITEKIIISNNNICPIYTWCPLRIDLCSHMFPPRVRIDDRYIICWKYFEKRNI